MTERSLAEAGLPATPAFCCVCERWFGETVLVRVVETGSGPGGMLYGCVPHARMLAARPDAPDWLREDLAKLDESPPVRARLRRVE